MSCFNVLLTSLPCEVCSACMLTCTVHLSSAVCTCLFYSVQLIVGNNIFTYHINYTVFKRSTVSSGRESEAKCSGLDFGSRNPSGVY